MLKGIFIRIIATVQISDKALAHSAFPFSKQREVRIKLAKLVIIKEGLFLQDRISINLQPIISLAEFLYDESGRTSCKEVDWGLWVRLLAWAWGGLRRTMGWSWEGRDEGGRASSLGLDWVGCLRPSPFFSIGSSCAFLS